MKKTKMAFRSIAGNRLNSTIIIISLAVGLACANLLLSFINRELNTDNFHELQEQIFALQCDDPWELGSKIHHCRIGSAEFMKANYAQVEDFCRISNGSAEKIVVNNNSYFDQPKIISASGNFFSFFSYNLLSNNPQSALNTEQDIVISEDLAKKYFGSLSAIGQVITLADRETEKKLVVTGVFKKPVENTQISFDMVRLIGEEDSRCYIRLASGIDKAPVEEQLKADKDRIPVIHGGTPGSYYLASLKDNYFDTTRRAAFEASRDKTDLWIALVIGTLIICVGAFNYLGLTNNKLIEKTKEFSVRKINGGTKADMVWRFLLECLILIGISFLLSLVLMLWMIPFFNDLLGTRITGTFIVQKEQFFVFLGVLLFLALITIIFLLFRFRYALRLSSFKAGANPLSGRVHFPVFNIFQVAVSVVLIIGSIVIIKQIRFIADKPIGLNKEVIEVKLPAQHAAIAPVFKDELSKIPSINQVSAANASPVLEHYLLLLKYNDNGEEKEYSPAGFAGDENYISTLRIKLIEGPGFTGNPATDEYKCLINQSLAKLFYPESLIGKNLPGLNDKLVAGVVEDFHYSNLKKLVAPAMISYVEDGRNLLVKSEVGQEEHTRKAIASIWQKLIPDYPLEMETIGSRYKWLHKENANYIKLVGACCVISIFLSMIGLYAVCFHSSRYRTKEIGIRKVNGASVGEVLTLLNKNSIKWVAIAFIIACPIAWYAMHKWLQNFAYKTELSWWIFALAGLVALAIALLTVSWQSWKAATRNPVEALRYE